MSVRFYAQFRDEDRHASPVSDAVSPEDAAIGFLECHHLEAAGETVAVIVLDYESGARHCFQIDLHSGEAAPCN